MKDDVGNVTELLHRWRHGDRDAADALLAATYGELRKLARAFMKNERENHTLQPTALVHEAYLRLFRDQPVDLESHEAFFRLIAAQMRRQLIDHGRKHRAIKRGAGLAHVDFEDVVGSIPARTDKQSDERLFARLEDVLARFEVDHPRAGQVVRLRFFGSLSNDEVAAALGLSSGTVKRDFAFARAWLARELADLKD